MEKYLNAAIPPIARMASPTQQSHAIPILQYLPTKQENILWSQFSYISRLDLEPHSFRSEIRIRIHIAPRSRFALRMRIRIHSIQLRKMYIEFSGFEESRTYGNTAGGELFYTITRSTLGSLWEMQGLKLRELPQ